MSKNFHIKIVSPDGENVVDSDCICIMGAVNLGDKKCFSAYSGSCSGGDRLVTLHCLVDTLHRVVKDILDEASFLKPVIEAIVAQKDSDFIFPVKQSDTDQR